MSESTSNSSYSGGIVGYSGSKSINVRSCYYLIESASDAIGSDSNNSGGNRTKSQLQQRSSFSGFDFEQVWGISNDYNNGYPYFRKSAPSLEFKNEIPNDFTKIYTPQDLDNIRNSPDGHYILMNDIDLKAWGDWTPIPRFTGVLDGDGFVIRNISINIEDDTSDSIRAGLFAILGESEIRNLGLVDGRISVTKNNKDGDVCVGGIAASASGTTITNCFNTCDISASTTVMTFLKPTVRAGGIAGHMVLTKAEKCYNSGNVSTSSISRSAYAGGIAGEGAFVSDCYNTGNISTFSEKERSCAGGIIGYAGGTDMVAERCFNVGKIQSSSQVFNCVCRGGILGYAREHSNFTITNCFYLESSADEAIGRRAGYGDFSQTFAEVEEVNTKALSSSAMKQSNSYTGFKFDSVWAIDPTVNNGYPYLRDLKS